MNASPALPLQIALLVLAVLLTSGCDRAVDCITDCSDCDSGFGVPGVPLLGTTWHLDAFEGHGDVLGEAQSTLTLSADTTTFQGQAACNEYFGTYTLTEEGRIVRLDVEAITEVGCRLNDYEFDLLEALERVASYRIGGRTLVLLEADGSCRLRFQAGRTSPD